MDPGGAPAKLKSHQKNVLQASLNLKRNWMPPRGWKGRNALTQPEVTSLKR